MINQMTVLDDAMTSDQVDMVRERLNSLPQFEPVTDHYFIADGDGFLYCRKVFRPAGIATLGRVHKKEHFYVIAKGRIALQGSIEEKMYEAGDVIISKPGTQRLVKTLEDSVTITMHKVSSMNQSELENELLEDDEQSNYDIFNHVKPHLIKDERKIAVSP